MPAAIPIAAAVGGALIASSATRSAAKSQSAATDRATEEQQRQYDQTRDDQTPFRQAGYSALEQLTGQVAQTRENFDAAAYLAAHPDVARDLRGEGETAGFLGRRVQMTTPGALEDAAWQHYQDAGRNQGFGYTYNAAALARQRAAGGGLMNRSFTGADALADPGYQFGLQQGMQALDHRVAAAGGRVSGAALKAAQRYGNDYASTKFGEAYQRRQDSLNRLAALAGIGQTSTANSAAAGAASSNAISSLISSQGNATAAGQIAQGNIWSNAGNQIAALAARNPQWFGNGLSYDPGGGYGAGYGGAAVNQGAAGGNTNGSYWGTE